MTGQEAQKKKKKDDRNLATLNPCFTKTMLFFCKKEIKQ